MERKKGRPPGSRQIKVGMRRGSLVLVEELARVGAATLYLASAIAA